MDTFLGNVILREHYFAIFRGNVDVFYDEKFFFKLYFLTNSYSCNEYYIFIFLFIENFVIEERLEDNKLIF